jgi:hypothetical protein
VVADYALADPDLLRDPPQRSLTVSHLRNRFDRARHDLGAPRLFDKRPICLSTRLRFRLHGQKLAQRY